MNSGLGRLVLFVLWGFLGILDSFDFSFKIAYKSLIGFSDLVDVIAIKI